MFENVPLILFRFLRFVSDCLWDSIVENVVKCHSWHEMRIRGLFDLVPRVMFLQIPRTRLSTLGSRIFSISGPSTWNDLPLPLQQNPSGLIPV